MKKLRVLVGCECSGRVRDAFIKLGHDAMSCDLVPSETPGPHYLGDVLGILGDGWDIGIFHPPCTYLCSSGLHWNKRDPNREKLTEESLRFVETLLNAPIPHIALENPIGCISTRIRKSDQLIQPYQFGDDASKSTCLWLKDLPLLQPTKVIPPRLVNGKSRWANQTDSGQNRLGPSPTRAADRSRTYQGIADAMAKQYSAYVLGKIQADDFGDFGSDDFGTFD